MGLFHKVTNHQTSYNIRLNATFGCPVVAGLQWEGMMSSHQKVAWNVEMTVDICGIDNLATLATIGVQMDCLFPFCGCRWFVVLHAINVQRKPINDWFARRIQKVLSLLFIHPSFFSSSIGIRLFPICVGWLGSVLPERAFSPFFPHPDRICGRSIEIPNWVRGSKAGCGQKPRVSEQNEAKVERKRKKKRKIFNSIQFW